MARQKRRRSRERARVSFTLTLPITTYALIRCAAARVGVSTRRWLHDAVKQQTAHVPE